ncbi:MAG: cytochrome C oxidase subunit IV family protein [Deltaproteobacteria bacterium]|nr:cytochrome C oxidase subunit IV family protein [Deltaproteobacteria bacterium]
MSGDAHSSDHVVSIKLYVAIFAALMALTALTVWVAFIDLGTLNTFMALAIAVAKASLVVLFFMHVKYSSKLTWLVVASGFVFLAIMLALTMSDIVSRGWLGTPGS